MPDIVDYAPGAGGGAMDPSLDAALKAYYASNPSFAAEYSRHMTQAQPGTDRRTPTEWLFDFLKGNPDQVNAFQAFASTNGNVTSEAGGDVPLEQDLLNRALKDYIYPDLDRDVQRRADGQSVLDRYNAAVDSAIAQNRQALDGTRLQEEYAMADQTGQRFRDAANAQATGQVGALDKLNADRLAALAPLNAERITAADTEVSGINQALEGERDRIAAEDGLNGFIGGSSMKDSALARAAYGARQSAAETMGGAKVLNASDTRSIWDDTAKGQASTEFGRLAGINTADQGVATDRKSYFDNDFLRRMQAALTPASLEANRFQLMGAADDYANSGLNRSLNTLNWWSTQPVQPNYSTFQTQASTAGNDIASLGAGLASAAGQYALAKKPTTASTYKGIPVANTPATATQWW